MTSALANDSRFYCDGDKQKKSSGAMDEQPIRMMSCARQLLQLSLTYINAVISCAQANTQLLGYSETTSANV
jgi:hypothetical protein